jgi:uncharacterized protein (TIGR02996 family)
MTDAPLASAEWAGFVWAMRSQPAADVPRLAAADWLEDTGRPELAAWAAYVRLQVEASHHPRRGHVYTDSCDCGACRPERRAVALFDRWRAHWQWHGVGDVDPKVGPAAADQYTRGFLRILTAELTGHPVAAVPKLVAPLFDRQPLVAAIVQLRRQTSYSYYVPLADWVLSIDASRVYPDHITVKGYLTRPPDTDPRHTIEAGRLAYTPQQFPRMVRAVAAEVLRKRYTIPARPGRGVTA